MSNGQGVAKTVWSHQHACAVLGILVSQMQYEALYNYYYYYTHLTASFQDKVSQYQIGKTSLNLTEARDDGVLGCSGISWTICKQSAPRSRQITTPTPHHSIVTGRTLFLTPNQHWRLVRSTAAVNQHRLPGPVLSSKPPAHCCCYWSTWPAWVIGSPGQWVILVWSSFTSGPPGHHFDPVWDQSFSGFWKKMPKMQNVVHLKCWNDKSHCQVSVVGLKSLDVSSCNELLLYLWLLKIPWPETTSSHISQHLEFIIEQGHRVNWVSGSLDSRVTKCDPVPSLMDTTPLAAWCSEWCGVVVSGIGIAAE